MNPTNRKDWARGARGLALSLLLSGAAFAAPAAMRFDFGSGAAPEGWTKVGPEAVYAADKGFGFEPGATLTAGGKGADDFVAGDAPFFFSARVPEEGNYRVTVTLAAGEKDTVTTIKAELRRLVAEQVKVAAGKTVKVSFIVNTRTPKIAAVGDIKAGEVKLKSPRESVDEAWAWDNALTLEFNGAHPAVAAVEIEAVNVPTVYLIGDSTVCDQSKEPYNSWGQMLPRFFKGDIAVANHGESGETYRDSIGRRRLDKILSVMKPGDYLIMQFGHNDQKQIGKGNSGPFTTYKEEIKVHVEGVRAHGGIPVIVSPMERRGFDADGKVKHSLGDYALAAKQSAEELKTAFIDLNAMSIPFYEWLEAHGPDYSRKAFAGQDNTHHQNYGSYELAKCIAQGLRDAKLEVAKHLVDDFKGFDPAKPDAVETFAVPASPQFSNLRPLGD